jgi:IS6 family transposase
VDVDHTTIYRSTAGSNATRLRWRSACPGSGASRARRPAGDETDVKVGGRWTYLYRAVDKHDDTIDFYPWPARSAKAAKGLLGNALRGLEDCVINADKAHSYGLAIAEFKADGKPPHTEHCQAMYLIQYR